MADIHGPVPGYAHDIATASDRLMSSLQVAKPLWRQNWSLLDSPELYQPVREPPGEGMTLATIGMRMWLRSERQTLRRLPTSHDILFTIRIRQATLEVVCKQPGAAQNLLLNIQTMPRETKMYKAIQSVEPLLVEYLSAYIGG